MDQIYRLFLPLRNPDLYPGQVLEWQFTKWDLEFLKHQYNCGGLDKHPDKRISLVIGKTFLRELLDPKSLFSLTEPVSEIEKSLSGSDQYFASQKNDSEYLVSLSIQNNDFMVGIINASNTAPAKFKVSYELPMLDLENALDLVESDHPGLDNGWFRNDGVGETYFALAPLSGPLRDYDVSFTKVIHMKSKDPIRVSARSKEEAHEKALGFAPESEYKEDRIDYQVNNNIREVQKP